MIPALLSLPLGLIRLAAAFANLAALGLTIGLIMVAETQPHRPSPPRRAAVNTSRKFMKGQS